MKRLRTIFFWLHLTAGSIAGLVIFAMALTGALLAFEPQINAWADAPAALKAPSDSAAKAPLDSLVVSLKDGGKHLPDLLVLRKAANAPVEARFDHGRTLMLNPWTAEIIGQPSERTRAFFRTVEQVHRSLGMGMQNAFGRNITGAGNLIFFFLLLSGLYLWLPRVYSVVSFKNRLLFRKGLKGRAREWNWHHVIGISTAIPLFFIVLTGVILSYPWASNLLFRMTGTPPPAHGWRGAERVHNSSAGGPADVFAAKADQYRSMDEIAAIAKQQAPAWQSLTLFVPDPGDRTVNVAIDTSPGGQPEKASQLVIDRRSGRIVSVNRFSNNSLGTKLRAWARFTHTGEEFGAAGQAIAAMACLGAMVLVWTGLSMAIRRTAGAVRSSRSKPAEERAA